MITDSFTVRVTRPVAVAIVMSAMAATVTAQHYRTDKKYTPTSLAGWHVLGDAAWRAENGEYVGTAKGPNGGWLVLDQSLQDTGFFAHFKCNGGCKSGVMLRAEKTPTGFKGVYVALTGEDVASYAVTLDANGKEVARERPRPGRRADPLLGPPPRRVTPPRVAARAAVRPAGGVAVPHPLDCRSRHHPRALNRTTESPPRSCSTPASSARF
jgi:hypothetical protein